MKKFILLLLIFFLFHGLLLYGATSKLDSKLAKKLMSGNRSHFIAFFFITLSFSILLMHRFIHFKFPYALSFLYSLGLAVLVEVIQKLLGYRYFSEHDILWGAYGSLFYIAIAKIFFNTKFGKKVLSFII